MSDNQSSNLVKQSSYKGGAAGATSSFYQAKQSSSPGKVTDVSNTSQHSRHLQ